MLDNLLLGLKQLVDVGTKGAPDGFRVFPDCFGVGDAPSGAEFDVDISQLVDVLLEIVAEDADLCNEQWPAVVGFVFACAVHQPGDQAVGGLPADRLSKAGHGQSIAKDRRLSPNVTVVINLDFCKVAGLLQPGEDNPAVFDTAPAKQPVSDILDEAATLEEADETADHFRGPAMTSALATLMTKA